MYCQNTPAEALRTYAQGVDNREAVRAFLRSRRARVTPGQAGVPAGTNRRVPGLRRSEVAALASISVEYYAKLERGALAGVSAGVLDAIAQALRLDDAERAHLFDLALAAGGTSALERPGRRASRQPAARPGLQWTLDAITKGPAFVSNGRMDLLAVNRLARAFFGDVYADPRRPANLARFTFLDRNARRLWPDWDRMADAFAALLHTEAGRDPNDEGLHTLIGELSSRSEEFRLRWRAASVCHFGAGTVAIGHPFIGDLTLAYEGFEMAADPGLTLTIYAAEPGSPSEESLCLLSSWAAEQEGVLPAGMLAND